LAYVNYVQLPRYLETAFDDLSPDLAYVLGYFSADGSMYKNPRGGCYIAFTSTDLELIESVKKILKISNAVEVYKLKNPNHNPRYTLQIGSKKLYQRFLDIGFTPNKSLIIKFPNIPKLYMRDFVRGFFDGDGCAYLSYLPRKNRSGVYRNLQIKFSCGNRAFLEDLQHHLIQDGIGKGSIYPHTSSYELSYVGTNVEKLYNLMYYSQDIPYLNRKKVVLEKGVNSFGTEV
jgi:hypothetical protein